ncbi:MAG: prepilin-type N-terminal cleavage/methylation domain-containing protein [Gemmatimonadetes bacterium]|nr:prepilin-type N-terminal cleavage/methylation domain-containing protein [Gemmatimonadota bacterium]
MRTAPAGATLVELLVVLAMLGVCLAVVTPSFRAATTPQTDSLMRLIAQARSMAIASRRPVVRSGIVSDSPVHVFARPDGRVTIDSAGRVRTFLAEQVDATR